MASIGGASCLRRIGRWLLVGGVLYGVGWLLWSARNQLSPFLIGLFLAYLLLPMVNRLNRILPRWIAIVLVYLGTLVVLISLLAYIAPLLWSQINQLIHSIPSFTVQDVRDQINTWLGEYERLVPSEVRVPLQDGLSTGYERLKGNLTTYVQEFGTFLFSSAMQVVNTVIFLLGFFIVPMWMFFVINDYRAGYRAINRMLPRAVRRDVWAIVRIVDRVLSSYIRGQLFLGVVVGLAAGLGLLVLTMFGLHVDFILLLAVIAGLTELVPVVGPVLGAVPAIIIGLFDSPTTALAVAILYLAIQQLENNFLVPRIIGDSVGFHPSVLIVLMIAFGQVFGFVGIVLAAPVSAVLRDVFLYVYGRLKDEPIEPPDVPLAAEEEPADEPAAANDEPDEPAAESTDE